MVERIFLGWDRPLLLELVDWLLARREELPGLLVVVPTAESGRRLREALAEAAGALLSPKVVTPGWFLKGRDDEAAADWIERVAWAEVLEEIADWSDYAALFPEKPGSGADWAAGLADEFTRLRRSLQDNGLMLAGAAARLAVTVEAERWQALARLEERVERRLGEWGFRSRSRMLAEGLEIPPAAEIVLAGVPEMAPLVERAWLGWAGKVSVLIGAPESEAEHFSPLGRPLDGWTGRPLPWPDGEVVVTADPRQAAAEALRLVADRGTPSDELALGSPDAETGDELARAFSRAGWPAFHPAAAAPEGGLVLWFRLWSRWLAEPSLARLADLLELPETGILTGGRRAQKARTLAQRRDGWMALRTEDLARRMAEGNFRSDHDREETAALLEAAEALERWRTSFADGGFPKAAGTLLEILARTGPQAEADAAAMQDWLAEAAPLIGRLRRGARFWIDQMLASVPAAAPSPPAGRVLDVLGWLELYHEPGRHLVLCGLNEGKIPARGGGEPWLGEASRKLLGLTTDAARAARDAFLFKTLLECRRAGGRVDGVVGKTGAGGETLLPSRLLLAAEKSELPRRVEHLFREVEPPEAGLRWQADWKWRPRPAEVSLRIGATAFTDWLACPLRYYLKRVLRMQSPAPARLEWDQRDFGTVAHEVLERFGRDTEAREFEKTEVLHRWLCAELDRVVAAWFGKRPPLAVRIQAESLRNRFEWLARVQCVSRVEGWEIIDVERTFELECGPALVRGKIDRIDRHRGSGQMRVLDYKTGSVEHVERAHRRKLTAASVLPAHLPAGSPALHAGTGADHLWTNLQLPLYVAALAGEAAEPPVPGYFKIGRTQAEVGILEWPDFSPEDLASALGCAGWVAEQIAAGVFGPPAEKPAYDDFAVLAAGRNLRDMVEIPTPLAPAAAG